MSVARPRLESPRLVLRLGEPADAGGIALFFRENAEHLARLESPRPEAWHTEAYWRARVPELERELEEDRSCRMFAFEKDRAGPPVGYVNFFTFVRGALQACTCGYALAEPAQGRGLMGEALATGLKFAFDGLHMHRVMANVRPENVRSRRLLERLGFEVEGYAKRYLYANGAWTDHVLLARVNDAWAPMPER